MASVLCRTVGQVARRSALITGVRTCAGIPVDPQKGKVVSDKVSMPDTIGHSVGQERYEMLAKLAGNEDPFEMGVVKRKTKGTKDDPTIIQSMNEQRVIGCVCEEDAVAINWMNLRKGPPQRCQCGYFFQLVDLEMQDYGQV